MNNSGSGFDFTQPPPGYLASSYTNKTSKKYGDNTPKGRNNVKPGNSVSEPAASPLVSYSEASSESSGKQFDSRATPVQSRSSYPNIPYANEVYNQYIRQPPPPPPPVAIYHPNAEMQPAGPQYYLYAYGPYSVPPPHLGATQYANQQQGDYHQQYQRDYNSGYYNRGGFKNTNNRKRTLPQELQDNAKKNVKKKKKPLSQNIPMRKDWSVEEAKKALEVEREFNKRHKSLSLIIKFPDLELNRDIVSKFHPKIDSVHFQLPSNPRFCFVTLKDSTNVDEVIKELNKIKFGYGYLTVEPKRDKEDDMNIGPEDIDPLTLYVGNLAQEVTVDDVVKAYPKNKRIDIGFAKKMKYTRYAFVCFRNVDDAIEAFQNTHATEMYSKSLIVRFRRLHGTVGLPGESKPQPFQKKTPERNVSSDKAGISESDFWKDQDNDFGEFQFKQEAEDSYLSDDYADSYIPRFLEMVTRRTTTASTATVNTVNPYDSDSSNSVISPSKRANKPEDSNVIKIKEEPPDESDVQPLSPHQTKSHVPMLEVKQEIDLEPLPAVKEESIWTDSDRVDPLSALDSDPYDDLNETLARIVQMSKNKK